MHHIFLAIFLVVNRKDIPFIKKIVNIDLKLANAPSFHSILQGLVDFRRIVNTTIQLVLKETKNVRKRNSYFVRRRRRQE